MRMLCSAGSRRTGETWSSRAYLAHGMRGRASEVATELLGERTIEQAQEARLKGGGSRAVYVAGPDDRAAFGRTARIDLCSVQADRAMARKIGNWRWRGCSSLRGSGLAQKERGTFWSVDEEFSRSLRELGARNDIIEQLYGQSWQRSRARAAHDRGRRIISPGGGYRHRQGKRR